MDWKDDLSLNKTVWFFLNSEFRKDEQRKDYFTYIGKTARNGKQNNEQTCTLTTLKLFLLLKLATDKLFFHYTVNERIKSRFGPVLWVVAALRKRENNRVGWMVLDWCTSWQGNEGLILCILFYIASFGLQSFEDIKIVSRNAKNHWKQQIWGRKQKL